MMNPRNTRSLQAPRWTNDRIIAAARRLGAEYEAIVGREYIIENGLQFDDVYDRLIYPRFLVELFEDDDLGVDENGQKILGRYDVRKNVAHLDKEISRASGDPRRIFTCWHEVAGHGTLQGRWLRKQLDESASHELIDVTEASSSVSATRELERQANLFAAHLAAPGWLISYAIDTTFRPRRRFIFIEPCQYWLDIHGLRLRKYIVDGDDLCGWIGSKISGFFGGLSAEALGYRIAEEGWLQDRSGSDLHLRRIARTEHQLVGV